MNLGNSLGERCAVEWRRVSSGLMFPSKVPDLRMCWYSILQGREGGREKGDSDVVGASSFVSTSALWVWNYYNKAGFFNLSTIDILGLIGFFFLFCRVEVGGVLSCAL